MNDPTLYGHGWHPEDHDERDLTTDHPEIHSVVRRTGVHKRQQEHLPSRVDLRKWCSPPQYQGNYQTCQCHVVAGMLEMLENRAFGDYVRVSRLFLYQVTRRLLQEHGDTGIYLRQMMGALSMVGVPPEKYWPYLETGTPLAPVSSDPRLDAAPDAFSYAVARGFGALKYYRLDPKDRPKQEVLDQIRSHVAVGLPTSIGFPMYLAALSLPTTIESGRIPFATGDQLIGNHAVVVVGYDDGLEIENANQPESNSTGAFLIRNTWGDVWGEESYGWLPYVYLLENHAKDVWAMVEPKWIDTGRFDLDLQEVDVPAPEKAGTKTAEPTS